LILLIFYTKHFILCNHPTHADKGFPPADDYSMHIRGMLFNIFNKHIFDGLFILITIILQLKLSPAKRMQ